ncbi:MAG: DUF6920 family protein [Alphaproteobacteria bacterium]
MKFLKILAFIILIILLIWGLGFVISAQQNKKVRQSIIKGAESQIIDLSPTRYADAPPLVQKYFNYAFNGKKQIEVAYIDWNEKGDFTLPFGQFKVSARQVSQAHNPRYIWAGLYKINGILPFLESRDAFMIESHNMRAKIGGWMTVMDTHSYGGQDVVDLYSQLLVRYYGAALNFPWVLLPSENITWIEQSDNQAILDVRFGELNAQYIVTFAENGAIIQMDTTEYLRHGNDLKLKEYGKKLDYKEVNGLMIPTVMDYSWYMEDGTLDTAYHFEIRDIKYKK